MSANRLKLNADKTELLWAGSRHCCLTLGNRGPKLQLGDDTIVPTNDLKVLGVTLSFDLTMDKRVSNVCSAGFYRLRQLRRVPRSLDTESAATLVHAFVTSRIDYCNVLLAGAPKATTDKLQRFLNAAARLLSGTKKFDRGLSQIMHANLHGNDVPERVKYKLATMVSPRQGFFVPDRLLHSYLRRCVTASSAFCQSSSATCPSTQSLHIWSSGFFCRGSGCLELPVRRTARTAVNCEQFHTVT